MSKEPIVVEHFRLDPADREANKWASICPSCKTGTLPVRRAPHTMFLEGLDICLLCGEQVQYSDIEEMRAKDWAGG